VIVAQSVAAGCLRHLKHFWGETAHVQIFKLHRNSSDFLIGFAPHLPSLAPELDINATVTSSHNQEQENPGSIPIQAHKIGRSYVTAPPLS
jgi:hypothetical protein